MKVVVSDEGFTRLTDDKTWNNLTDAQREGWTILLMQHAGAEQGVSWLEPFAKAAAKKDGTLGKASKPLTKAFLAAFGVRGPDADPVTDDDGNVVADDQLTDFENVPLNTPMSVYMAAEVLPHAPDALCRSELSGRAGR